MDSKGGVPVGRRRVEIATLKINTPTSPLKYVVDVWSCDAGDAACWRQRRVLRRLALDLWAHRPNLRSRHFLFRRRVGQPPDCRNSLLLSMLRQFRPSILRSRARPAGISLVRCFLSGYTDDAH